MSYQTAAYIPSDFNSLVKSFGIIKYIPYELPDNFNKLSSKDKVIKLCLYKDNQKILKNSGNYLLGNYIEKLRNLNKSLDETTKEAKLVSLKLLFIYEYFKSKNIDDDINDDFEIEWNLINCGLREYFEDLLQNYNNYCILKDYIDNKYYVEDYKLNFVNYEELDYKNLTIFLSNIELGFMDYKKLLEIIINNCEEEQKYDEYELNKVLYELKLYNIYPYPYYTEKNINDEDNSDIDEIIYSSSDSEDDFDDYNEYE
jgi:hypothetical protein